MFSYIGNPSNTKGMDLHNKCNVNNNWHYISE